MGNAPGNTTGYFDAGHVGDVSTGRQGEREWFSERLGRILRQRQIVFHRTNPLLAQCRRGHPDGCEEAYSFTIA
jgi:hypothetical protein